MGGTTNPKFELQVSMHACESCCMNCYSMTCMNNWWLQRNASSSYKPCWCAHHIHVYNGEFLFIASCHTCVMWLPVADYNIMQNLQISTHKTCGHDQTSGQTQSQHARAAWPYWSSKWLSSVLWKSRPSCTNLWVKPNLDTIITQKPYRHQKPEWYMSDNWHKVPYIQRCNQIIHAHGERRNSFTIYPSKLDQAIAL